MEIAMDAASVCTAVVTSMPTNIQGYLVDAASVIATAAAVTALIPLPKTGTWGTVANFINVLALNIGKAQNKE